MPKKFSIYWYKEGPEFKQAFLYNLRDNDVQEGGRIAKGAIVQGAVGLVAAEVEVFGWTGNALPFNPNRRCDWHDFELPCMASPRLPAGKVAAGLLRDGNYAVAAITSDEVKALADSLKVTRDGFEFHVSFRTRFGENKTETVTFGKSGSDAFASRSDEPGAAKLDAMGLDEAMKTLDAVK